MLTPRREEQSDRGGALIARLLSRRALRLQVGAPAQGRNTSDRTNRALRPQQQEVFACLLVFRPFPVSGRLNLGNLGVGRQRAKVNNDAALDAASARTAAKQCDPRSRWSHLHWPPTYARASATPDVLFFWDLLPATSWYGSVIAHQLRRRRSSIGQGSEGPSISQAAHRRVSARLPAAPSNRRRTRTTDFVEQLAMIEALYPKAMRPRVADVHRIVIEAACDARPPSGEPAQRALFVWSRRIVKVERHPKRASLRLSAADTGFQLNAQDPKPEPKPAAPPACAVEVFEMPWIGWCSAAERAPATWATSATAHRDYPARYLGAVIDVEQLVGIADAEQPRGDLCRCMATPSRAAGRVGGDSYMGARRAGGSTPRRRVLLACAAVPRCRPTGPSCVSSVGLSRDSSGSTPSIVWIPGSTDQATDVYIAVRGGIAVVLGITRRDVASSQVLDVGRRGVVDDHHLVRRPPSARSCVHVAVAAVARLHVLVTSRYVHAGRRWFSIALMPGEICRIICAGMIGDARTWKGRVRRTDGLGDRSAGAVSVERRDRVASAERAAAPPRRRGAEIEALERTWRLVDHSSMT